MRDVIIFMAGLWIGAAGGVVTAALCAAARRESEECQSNVNARSVNQKAKK